MSSLDRKNIKLEKILSGYKSVLLAFSGGVDSTFLLAAAKKVLGENVLAVTAVSETYSAGELKEAKNTAKTLKAKHLIIKTCELQDKRFSSNPPERCYFCKSELFTQLKYIARKKGIKYVIDASNKDDLKDFRPGSKAKKELGVRSPLQEAGLTKDDIRKLSRNMGLITWNRPSAACLASRLPYGEKITKEKLRKIEKAENLINCLLGTKNIAPVRVRSHGNIARIELGKDGIKRILGNDIMKKIVSGLKSLGFKYVTVDLEGFRSGSMNEVLK